MGLALCTKTVPMWNGRPLKAASSIRVTTGMMVSSPPRS